MTLKNCLFSLLLTLTGLALVECAENPFQSSKLPKEMPAKTEISFADNGGMARAYRRIVISGEVLTSEVLTTQQQDPTIWAARITRADEEKLYQAFVANKFDLIKNDERRGIVYDAGSEGVTLVAGDETYNKTYGRNSPMSGASLNHYQTVAAAINELAAKYEKKGDRIPAIYTILNYEPQSYSWVFKNVKPATLSDDEITNLQELLKKAVAEHNLSLKRETAAIDLARYKFQYVPVVNEKSEKEVWVNSFCQDFDGDWRNQLIMVKDGGNCYFNLKINLSAKIYSDFSVNGEG